MPLGDRRGPSGMGPGTGRAFGYCYGFDSPGHTREPGSGMGRGGWSGYGRGLGRGRSFMTGRGRGFYGQGFAPGFPAEMPAMNKDEKIKMLKSKIDYLNNEQKNIEKRLKELDKE
ncbi:MAG: DUF5320 domain-containing protein [Bacteroidales bacterium]|nr:DUF5320 domain-containing protein [Bacteroidales bacterium]